MWPNTCKPRCFYFMCGSQLKWASWSIAVPFVSGYVLSHLYLVFCRLLVADRPIIPPISCLCLPLQPGPHSEKARVCQILSFVQSHHFFLPIHISGVLVYIYSLSNKHTNNVNKCPAMRLSSVVGLQRQWQWLTHGHSQRKLCE